ncbi:MAG: Bug family tripartite tricarboxylate transporter substrate binding protein [Hyphomicrobiales bacterium]
MVKLRVGLVALVAAVSTAADAQDWPSRPLRFVVPFPAGGSTDVGARLIGEHLSRSLGQQIIVENKSGASGNIGMETAAKSAADGYTVLVTTDAVSSNPHVYKMNIDPSRELTPVIQLSRQPIVLAAHPSVGIASLAELIALARQQPGLRYATGSGVGAQHMVVQWFASIAGIKLEQVPYRGGAPAINDLIAGHVKLGSLGSTPLIPHYKAGTLRLLAQSTQARSPSLPNVPTYQEAGIKGLVLEQWPACSCQRERRPPSWPASTPTLIKPFPKSRSARASCNRPKSRSAGARTHSRNACIAISRPTHAW